MTTTAYKIVFTQNNADAMKRVSDIIGKKLWTANQHQNVAIGKVAAKIKASLKRVCR